MSHRARNSHPPSNSSVVPDPFGPVLEKLWDIPPEEAAAWLLITAAAKAEGSIKGRTLANRFANHLKSRGMLPLDSTEDLPPHIIGRVSLASTEASVIHSFDLDNLSGFPDAMKALASDGPSDGGVPTGFLVFLDRQPDLAYLRRVTLARNPTRAEALLRSAIAHHSRPGPAHYLLLDLLESQSRWKEATEEARRFVDRSSEASEIEVGLINLAEILCARGLPEQAASILSAPPSWTPTPGYIESLPAMTEVFAARGLRTPGDADLLTSDLMGFLRFVREQANELLPGALEEALKTYRHLPEWTAVEKAGVEDRPMEETLSFDLYLTLAHRSAEWPDPLAEVLYRHHSKTYALGRQIDEAIHRSRCGRFEVVQASGADDQRRLITLRDLLTHEELRISFAPSSGPEDLLDRAGTVFRAHLVPWGGLWFVRGPVEIPDDTRAPEGPRLWWVDMLHIKEEFWAAYVIEGTMGLAASAVAEHYAAPGPVTRALAMAFRTTGHLPDLLVSPEGFPYVDPSGRTATSWREPAALPMGAVLAPPGSVPAQSWPHPVSLLKPWVETFGIRHVTDALSVEKATREFRDVVRRDLARQGDGPRRPTELGR